MGGVDMATGERAFGSDVLIIRAGDADGDIRVQEHVVRAPCAEIVGDRADKLIWNRKAIDPPAGRSRASVVRKMPSGLTGVMPTL
jgi:hypothetical protein